MTSNYLYLLRCVKELNEQLSGYRLNQIYTQEKDKLFLQLTNHDSTIHLIISTNPHLPYLTISEEHKKAKKNTINFLDEFMPDFIQNISIADKDRIIRIELSKTKLYFVIRGSATNIFFLENKLSSFKKAEQKTIQTIIDEMNGLHFINTFDGFLVDLTDDSYEQFIKQNRFIDKNIQQEITLRNKNWKTSLLEIIDSIFYKPILVFYDGNRQKSVFQPIDFLSTPQSENLIPFEKYIDAVNYYLTYQQKQHHTLEIKNEIDKFITKKLDFLTNKLNNLKSKIYYGSKEKEYKHHGDLILSNLNLIKKGMKEVELEDLSNKTKIKIKLDDKTTPTKNAEKYFQKARAEKINFEKASIIYNDTLNQYNYFHKLKIEFEKSYSLAQLIQLKKVLKLKSKMEKEKSEIKVNFRHFIIEDKYHLYVGKDSKNNDLLTTRFAKQNDYWFHARSVSGSHVVLRVENSKEGIPKSIFKKAASIAAFYSKAKSSKLVSVSYTLKKYVVKNKKMPQGQVSLLREQVLLVPPEIPDDCSFVDNE